MVAAAAQCDHTGKTVGMCMCEADGVVAAGREGPDAYFVFGNGGLGLDPIQQTAPLSVGGCRVGGCGGRVAGTRDLDDDGADAVLTPSFHPDGELGAVTVQTGHDEDHGSGIRFAGIRRKKMVDWDVLSFAFDGVFVWDLNLVDGVFAKAAKTCQTCALAQWLGNTYPRPLIQAFLPSCQA